MYRKKEVDGSLLTTQTLLHTKVFGDHLSHCRPLDYRRQEWHDLIRGRERSVRLITKAMLGVPSAHAGEHEHAMWCFQFPLGSMLVVYLHRGSVVELSAKVVEGEKELLEAVDFLHDEVTTRLKQL